MKIWSFLKKMCNLKLRKSFDEPWKKICIRSLMNILKINKFFASIPWFMILRYALEYNKYLCNRFFFPPQCWVSTFNIFHSSESRNVPPSVLLFYQSEVYFESISIYMKMLRFSLRSPFPSPTCSITTSIYVYVNDTLP